jgi:CubicO group peptidase (beta-lactamase class C family)
MRRLAVAFVTTLLLVPVAVSAAPAPARPAAAQAIQPYFPDRLTWERKRPEEVGMNAARLDEAVKLATASENPANKGSMANFLAANFGAREPLDTPIGPVKDRGVPSGIVVRNGYIVAEWGEPNRVDMTFSVTKTFVTTMIGLAWQRGLIKDTNDFARDYMPAGSDLFESEHNRKIRWEHLLRQTSDWQGTLWGKPDWVDRPEGDNPAEWPNRKLSEPGARYKYNDVRVNLLALAGLYVWRRPLPEVLRTEIMDPIGASSTWRWHGYENSWVEIDGQRMQSVSAGGHWGGGLQINAYDMGRFGYLFLRNGKWKDREIVSETWIEKARTPGPGNPDYGYANWYPNVGKRTLASAPESAVFFSGNGRNVIYIDRENDVVAVIRWIREGNDALNAIVGGILGSIERPSARGRQAAQ